MGSGLGVGSASHVGVEERRTEMWWQLHVAPFLAVGDGSVPALLPLWLFISSGALTATAEDLGDPVAATSKTGEGCLIYLL